MTNQETEQIEVLLVEDDKGSCLLTERTLMRSGITSHVTMAHDGLEALAILRQHDRYSSCVRPDLVLLDLKLPRMNGYEVLAEIRKDPALRHIPVIILTFSVFQDDMQKCYDLQANGYISKPINMEQFKALIHSLKSGTVNA